MYIFILVPQESGPCSDPQRGPWTRRIERAFRDSWVHLLKLLMNPGPKPFPLDFTGVLDFNLANDSDIKKS